MTRHHYVCPLRWGDMDAQGHVNNGAFLDYLQDARVHFLLTGPQVMGELLATGVLVVSHQVEYLKPLGVGPRGLGLDLWINALGASRFEIGYELFDGDALVARARTAAAPYDLATDTLRRLRPEERAVFAEYLEPAAALRPLPKGPPPEDDHQHPLSVRWSDLDSYGHVNNVKFFDYVQEARLALMTEVFGWPVGDHADRGWWLVVRQDIEYRRPLDFRLEPYVVRTTVAAVGNRSFTLAVRITDQPSGTVFATARTVVVAPTPLTTAEREQLAGWAGPS